MTNRIGGDSTTLADIPLNLDVALVYGNGKYLTTPAAVEARFPVARYGRAWIDVNGTGAAWAQVLDVETGDATPDQGVKWIRDWHSHHQGLPVIYCNVSTLPAVVAACSAAGLKRGVAYGLWIATLDGHEVPHQAGDGIVACQRDGAAQTGGHWDRSVIYDPNIWRPLTPAPKPVPVVTLADVYALAVETSADIAELRADLAKLAGK